MGLLPRSGPDESRPELWSKESVFLHALADLAFDLRPGLGGHAELIGGLGFRLGDGVKPGGRGGLFERLDALGDVHDGLRGTGQRLLDLDHRRQVLDVLVHNVELDIEVELAGRQLLRDSRLDDLGDRIGDAALDEFLHLGFADGGRGLIL